MIDFNIMLHPSQNKWIFFFTFTTVEFSSGVSSSIKWFQPPPDRSCGGSNHSYPYQVRRQSPLNQLMMPMYNFNYQYL
jgi:hypothetical protein